MIALSSKFKSIPFDANIIKHSNTPHQNIQTYRTGMNQTFYKKCMHRSKNYGSKLSLRLISQYTEPNQGHTDNQLLDNLKQNK